MSVFSWRLCEIKMKTSTANLLVAEVGLTLILLTVNAHVLIKALVCGGVDVSSAVTCACQIMHASRLVSRVACHGNTFRFSNFSQLKFTLNSPIWCNAGTDLLLRSCGPGTGEGFCSAPTLVMSRSDILRPPAKFVKNIKLFNVNSLYKQFFFIHANEHQMRENKSLHK